MDPNLGAVWNFPVFGNEQEATLDGIGAGNLKSAIRRFEGRQGRLLRG